MNKKIISIIIITAVIIIILIILFKSRLSAPNQQNNIFNVMINNNYNANSTLNNNINTNTNSTNPAASFSPPITDWQNRVTKKPFGIYITSQNSPVQPERFSGYHTGVDFETFSDEANVDVPIYAFCDGKILVKEYASGYGGVLVQSCVVENQPVTIIYGHLRLSSINKKVDDSLIKGETIGVLGTGYSTETNGERKHLHFGIHKGTTINILGYVQKKEALNNWLDPMNLL